jgi:DNA-binding MarR family transcriptional regulator
MRTHDSEDANGSKRPDPTEQAHWGPLHRLFKALDREIEEVYAEHGIVNVSARLTKPLIRLSRGGDMTIKQLASALGLTHSAASQTVSLLKRDGLVETIKGEDGRTRVVSLTERAQQIVPFLEAEWMATEHAVAELERELPYPLTRVVSDIEAALARLSFRERVAAHLVDP